MSPSFLVKIMDYTTWAFHPLNGILNISLFRLLYDPEDNRHRQILRMPA